MHSEIAAILLELTTVPDAKDGEPPLSRKQIAGWIGKSTSYVDKRFQGVEEFKGSDIDAVIEMAFELDIKKITDRYIPDGQRLVDYQFANFVISGTLDDNISSIMENLVKVKEIGKDCEETDKMVDQIIEQALTILKELKAKS